MTLNEVMARLGSDQRAGKKRIAALMLLLMLMSATALAQDGPDPNRPGAREVIEYNVPDEVDIDYAVLDSIDTSTAEFGVVPLPADVGATLTGLFTKYTKHLAPNGKPIHILGQAGVSELQMVRAREILKYHLTDVPGTAYGSHKTDVANRMGDVRATLIYTDTQARAFAMYDILEPSDLALQDLYATESPVEGDYIYLNNKAPEGGFFTRDASYEEIMHLVHSKAIEDELPEYHAAIERAEQRAVDAGIYKYGSPAPHEYIISGFDIYFGLWDHDPQGDGTSYGDEYPYHTRAEMKEGDRPLYDAVVGFWPEYLTYNAYIDPSFDGTFAMVHEEGVEYTNKSRFLVQVTLTGDNDNNVFGNDQDNILTGNRGDNTITGGAGDDMIDGGSGLDRATFTGARSEYRVETNGSTTTVADTVDGRDGSDELDGIEVLVFSDQEVQTN
jgi:hypothetical protein